MQDIHYAAKLGFIVLALGSIASVVAVTLSREGMAEPLVVVEATLTEPVTLEVLLVEWDILITPSLHD